MDSSKYNCIELKVNNVKNKSQDTLAIICLDSEDQLLDPVIDGKLFDSVKTVGVIPVNTYLHKSRYSIEAADGTNIVARGILKNPLGFYGNQELGFVLNSFLVIDGLSTDMNFGKETLEKLTTK